MPAFPFADDLKKPADTALEDAPVAVEMRGGSPV
jgi:hypothetical protein